MKRNIIIFISVVVAGLVGFWVIRQLSFGTISIVTNDQEGQVTLQQTGFEKEPKKVGKGDTSVKVSPGDYTVEISHDNKITRGAVTATKGEESSLNLQIKELKAQEKIVDYTALSIYATDSSLSFLNAPQKSLYKFPLDAERADLLSEAYPIAQVHHWYNSDSAFFQNGDGTYHLLANGTDTPIDLTGDANLTEADALDINTKGEVVYVYDQKLYYRPNVIGVSSEIASLKNVSGGASVALNNNGTILVSFAPEGSGDNNDDSADAPAETSPALLINVATKSKKQLPTIIANGHWSPDSKRFVGTTERGLELFSAAGAPIKLISSLINSTANTVTWVNNSEFIYADNKTVWLYNIIDGVSSKVAQIDGSLAQNNPFAISGKAIYYETDPKPTAGSVGTIFRIDL